VPYRLDFTHAADHSIDRLIELGALDVESFADGSAAALMPDNISPTDIAGALGTGDFSVSSAVRRDDGSVWVLSVRPVFIGTVRVRLIDGPAFGTGLHPTTSLGLEAVQEAVRIGKPDRVLDVGTGSGVLALAALMMGVPRALGIDIDATSLRVATENARLNGVADRLDLQQGGPETVTGLWPLVLANILAAPLLEMAPALVQRVGHRGRLILSGIPASLEHDVDQAYCRLGMRRLGASSRGGWVALVLDASW
jgi:ribosomal protein L11 methylase PrmA